MAKVKGLVSFKGTMEGINFYYLYGKPVARRAGGGFNGDAIKNDPDMVRVRENGSEFGRVAKDKMLIKKALYPLLKDLGDVTLHGRMMSLFHTVKTLDVVSARGERRFDKGLATEEGRSLLTGFNFTTQKASSMLPGDGVFDVATQCYTVSNINLSALRLPVGATGMQVCFGVLEADFTARTSKLFMSNAVFITADFSGNSFTLIPNALPTGAGVRFAVLQVRYYQELNGARFLFHELKAQGLEFVEVYSV